MRQQVAIYRSNLAARSAVHEHRVEDVHLYNVIAQLAYTAWRTLLERCAVACGVESLAVEDGIAAVGNTHDVQLQAVLLLQFLLLRCNLLDEAAAHCSNAADEEVQHLVLRQEERVVYDTQCLAQQVGFYDE